MKRWLAKYIGPEGLITVKTIGRNVTEARRVAAKVLENQGHAEGATFLRIEERA